MAVRKQKQRTTSRRMTRKLSTYRAKRNFRATSEPAGAAAARPGKQLRFVIQKHAARRLHFDLRLELDGVYKSWAVPKGLPTKPGMKALAIEVEDHPLDYGNFEGTIPAGNYGAGTVMLWDRGVYAAVSGDVRGDYRAGHMHLVLVGAKSRGEWTLVRMRPDGKSDRNWLLLKNRDLQRRRRESPGATARKRDVSVATGRTMEEITAGTARKQRASREDRAGQDEEEKEEEQTDGVTGKAGFIEPMKARGVTEIPAGNWHLEIKFDGYRAIARLHGGKVKLWSRNELSLAADYPEVVSALEGWGKRAAVLDGEIVALDAEGRSRFQLLQARELHEARPPIIYYVFDLLVLDGRSLLNKPIEERRAALTKLVGKRGGIVRLSPVFDMDPARLMAEVRQKGLEGIVAKAPGSRYESGRRSGAWLKCRIVNEQEFIIGGYTPPQGARRHFGALLLGYYEGGELRYAGKVGTGFDERRLDELNRLFAARRREACPFSAPPPERRAHWVRPDLVAQIRFVEWTTDGRLRQPVFLGLRRDKPAREVVREASKAPRAGRKRA